jgi:adenylate kinase
MGPSGSCRSTLAKELSRKFGFIYVSTRELIVDLINKKGEAGKIALTEMNVGNLVPDDIMATLFNARIN